MICSYSRLILFRSAQFFILIRLHARSKSPMQTASATPSTIAMICNVSVFIYFPYVFHLNLRTCGSFAAHVRKFCCARAEILPDTGGNLLWNLLPQMGIMLSPLLLLPALENNV
jgi:hypothetical protein